MVLESNVSGYSISIAQIKCISFFISQGGHFTHRVNKSRTDKRTRLQLQLAHKTHQKKYQAAEDGPCSPTKIKDIKVQLLFFF